MKQCPVCGYEDTVNQRQGMRRLARYFGDIPVRQMMRRGWIATVDITRPDAMWLVRRELMRFIGAETIEVLAEEFDLSTHRLASLGADMSVPEAVERGVISEPKYLPLPRKRASR